MKFGMYGVGMSAETGIFCFENCDTRVAMGINKFAALKAGYGTSCKRKPIWRLLGACLDDAVLQFASRFKGWASTELMLEARGISSLGTDWRERANVVLDRDFVRAKRLVKHELRNDLVIFVETLASLTAIMFASLSHTPVVVTSGVGGARLRATTKGDRHYPYCELCWRYSAAAKSLSRLELDSLPPILVRDRRIFESEAGTQLGSLRFCSLHDPGNPTLKYRSDVEYRERFWKFISLCRRRFVKARNRRLLPYDTAIPIRTLQVLRLHEEGFSVSQIGQLTELPLRTVVDALAAQDGSYRELLAAEEHFALPDEALIRQAAYLLVHKDVVGLLDLESRLPGIAISALHDLIRELFEEKLAPRTHEIVRLSRGGLAKAEIAAQLGVSRQLVHNALNREFASAYMRFLDATEAELSSAS